MNREHRKSVCINGHRFTRGNTYVAPNGSRMCRICRQRAQQAYRDRQIAWSLRAKRDPVGGASR